MYKRKSRVRHGDGFFVPLRDSQKEQANVCSLLHIMAQILLYYNVGRKNKLCIYAGRKPTRRRYRRVLYFLAATPYSTTFCRETWHNRVAEAANDVTFDFSSGFYNRFPITGCRIRRFLCGIHHRRVLSRRDGFPARLLLYFLCFTSRLYNALPQEMSIAEPPQDRKNSRKEAKKGYAPGIAAFMKVSCQRDRSFKA